MNNPKITQQHIKDLLGLARKCNEIDDRLGVDNIEIGRDLWHMEDTLLGIVSELEKVQEQNTTPEPDPAIFLEENGISGDATVDHEDGAVYAADIMEVYAKQVLYDTIHALVLAHSKLQEAYTKYDNDLLTNNQIEKIEEPLKKIRGY